MAWKAKQLKAVHQIVGVLKSKKPIEPGTFFEAKNEEDEKHLLRVGAAVEEDLPGAPSVVKEEAPKKRAPAKKSAPKPAPKPEADGGEEELV